MIRPYRSGHCTPGNVDEQHRRCTGAYAGATCACDCHVARSEAEAFGLPTSFYEREVRHIRNEIEQPRDEIDAFDWDQYAAMGESA